ncbi:MAG: hypothetical protein M3O85_08090, partial [Acidobacteriota bacterium]|nr:hypothetical protein [Acidobacteriota bacterium]
MPVKALPKATFKLDKVFDLKVNPDSSKAFLSPSGKKIFLLDGPLLSVIDWKSKVTTATKDFSALPCDHKKPDFFHWIVLPSESEAVASYCDQLFVINLETLSAKGPLNASGGSTRLMVASLRVDLVAVEFFRKGAAGPTNEVVVFETHNWEPVQRWAVDANSLAFSPDGSLLAIGRSAVDAGETVRSVGAEVRSLRTGEVTAQWWCEVAAGCAGNPQFLTDLSDVLCTSGGLDEPELE